MAKNRGKHDFRKKRVKMYPFNPSRKAFHEPSEGEINLIHWFDLSWTPEKAQYHKLRDIFITRGYSREDIVTLTFPQMCDILSRMNRERFSSLFKEARGKITKTCIGREAESTAKEGQREPPLAELPSFVFALQLAEAYCLPVNRVRVELNRVANKDLFLRTEIKEPKARGPKFLYDTARAKPVIETLKKKYMLKHSKE